MIEQLVAAGRGVPYPYPGDEYLGEVSAGEFIDGTTLASYLGFSTGIAQNAAAGWLKFKSQDGYTFLVAKRSFRYRVSWDSLNTAKAIDGSRSIIIAGNIYKIRLLKGAEANPSGWTTAMGQNNPPIVASSEWNRFMHRVSVNNPGPASNWASFTDVDLGVAGGTTLGRMTLCTEAISSITNNVAARANTALSQFNYVVKSDGANTGFDHYGWRPVLELVGPAVYLPDSGPGPKYLQYGDQQLGYFGEVSADELIFNLELKAHINPSIAGTIRADTGWLKFCHQGKVKFINKGGFAGSMTWQAVYQAGAAYGTNDNGKYPSGTPVNQRKPMTIRREGKDLVLVPKMLSCYSADPIGAADTTGGNGNEYVDLLCRVTAGGHPGHDEWASNNLTSVAMNIPVTALESAINTANSNIKGYGGVVNGAASISKTDGTGYNQSIRMTLVLEGTTVRPQGDPLLLLDPSNLADGSTAIVDRSASPIPITNTGGVVVSSEGPKPGVKSLYFKSSGWSYLTLPSGLMPNLQTGDFTIEYWFKPESNPSGGNAGVIGQWKQAVGVGGFVVTNRSDGQEGFSFGPYNENGTIVQAAAPGAGWVHRTITRKGDLFQMWQNGVVVASLTSAANRKRINVDWTIGTFLSSSGTVPPTNGVPLNGWLAKLKVYDFAKYDAPFTPD